jgi:hypothetical protein
MADRTAAEHAQFGFSLWEMSRLYSFKDVEVVVLSQLVAAAAFPQGTGAPSLRNGTVLHVSAGGLCRMTSDGGVPVGSPLLTRTCTNETAHDVRVVLSGLREEVGELIEHRADGVSLVLSNGCGWGLLNAEPYECRGWVRATVAVPNSTARSVPNSTPWSRPASCCVLNATTPAMSPQLLPSAPQ